jgi:hypothetical protein
MGGISMRVSTRCSGRASIQGMGREYAPGIVARGRGMVGVTTHWQGHGLPEL